MRVEIDLKPLHKFQAQLNADLSRSANGPVRQAVHQWAARFRSFTQERFDRFSKGGGSWPALALSTIARRRRGKTGRQTNRNSLARDTRRGGRLVAAGGVYSILRDTGQLFAALTPFFSRKPGQLQQDIPFGVRVGVGPDLYDSTSTQAVTIQQIAQWHQEGAGHLPKREIIVPPDERTVSQMAADMERAIRRLSESTGNS